MAQDTSKIAQQIEAATALNARPSQYGGADVVRVDRPARMSDQTLIDLVDAVAPPVAVAWVMGGAIFTF